MTFYIFVKLFHVWLDRGEQDSQVCFCTRVVIGSPPVAWTALHRTCHDSMTVSKVDDLPLSISGNSFDSLETWKGLRNS